MNKICSHPECDALIPANQTRCPKHLSTTPRGRKPRKYAKSSPLYSTSKWRATRKVVLERQRYCQQCGSQERLVVDHLTPHREDTELFFDLDNLMVLCKQCHDRKTSGEIQVRRRSRKLL